MLEKFRKERNLHRMHHCRIAQEKNKLVVDIKVHPNLNDKKIEISTFPCHPCTEISIKIHVVLFYDLEQ